MQTIAKPKTDFSKLDIRPWNQRPRLAIDAEATGAAVYHGSKPFMFSVTSEAGYDYTFEWDVDVHTREPIYDYAEARRLYDLLAIDKLPDFPDDKDRQLFLFHNATFDVRCLAILFSAMEIPFNTDKFLRYCDDTMIQAHCLDNLGNLGLKDLAFKRTAHFPVEERLTVDDQEALRVAVENARDIAKRLGWAIASKETCPYQDKAPKGDANGDGWWVMDMWVPKAVAKHLNYPSEHPFYHVTKRYNCKDTLRTLVLARSQETMLSVEGLTEVYARRRRLLPSVYRMQDLGVSVREEEIEPEQERCRNAFVEHSAKAGLIIGWGDVPPPDYPKQPKVKTIVTKPSIKLRRQSSVKHVVVPMPFNPNSSDQVQYAFFNKFGLPVERVSEKTGNPTTDKEFVRDLLDDLGEANRNSDLYRFAVEFSLAKKYGKSASTCESYRKKLLTERLFDTEIIRNVLHTELIIPGTVTTRFASRNPNLQNISKGKEAFIPELREAMLTLRKLFGPSPGREWYAIDGKQLQLVIFAYCSGDQQMIKAFEQGVDFHDMMQRVIFGKDYIKGDDAQRTIAKNVNFGFAFGASEGKINSTSGMSGCYAILKKNFPSAINYIHKNKAFAKKHGHVFTPGGYRLSVSPEQTYAATNYIVQGSEGEIVQLAMELSHDYLMEYCPEAYVTLQVHDELVFDFPKGEGEYHVANLMEIFRYAGEQLYVPCDCDAKYIDTRWDKSVSVVLAS